MSNVFIIINEWTAIDCTTGSEIVGARFFETELSAWEALRDIAHSFEDDLDYGGTSLTYENPTPSLEYEEYYIQELTRG